MIFSRNSVTHPRGLTIRCQTTGNFHTILTFKTDEELNTVRGLVHRMVERALALDGTCKVAPSSSLPLKTQVRFHFRHGRTRRRDWKERVLG